MDAILRLADQVRLGALKTLKGVDEWTRDPEHAEQRLLNEIAALKEVEHPNIQRVLDSDSNQPWLVTEYHQRGTLADNVRLFQHDPLATLKAFRGLVSAVDRIHEHEAIHRDIKPENIFLATDGHLVLGDFGLVLPSDATERPTATGDNAGTYQWMPPWGMNVPHEFIPTFDVYSLGKILWWMLAPRLGLPLEYEAGNISSIHGGSRIARLIEGLVARCVVLQKHDCIPDTRTLLSEVDEVFEEAHSAVPTANLKIAAHAMTRPGGLHLVSVEASKKKAEPVSTPRVIWKFWHPRATGRGKQLPGILDVPPGSDPSGQPAIPDDALWEEFVAFDDHHRRWLIQPPQPTSWDNPIECQFEDIPVHHARYVQLAVQVGERSRTGFYVRFEDRWILYSSNVTQLSKDERALEYEIPTPELAASDSIQIVVRDIQRDLSQTWHTDGIHPEVLNGVRFRGDFRLLFLRII